MALVSTEVLPAKKHPLLTSLILFFLLAMILTNIGGNMYGPLLSLYIEHFTWFKFKLPKNANAENGSGSENEIKLS